MPVRAREWRIYRVRGFVEPLLYLGITSQRIPYARLQQHVGDLAGNIASARKVAPKWWAPLATGWDLDPAVYATRADAEAAEARAIRAERPRYNIQHNQGNPHRWRSMADVPLEQRPAAMAVSPAPVSQPRPAWTSERAFLVVAITAWPTLFGVLDWAGHNAGAAAVLTVVAFWVTWHRSGRRRRRRRVW